MVPDPIDPLLTLIGICVWPGLTLCVILWKLGHPVLGIIALLVVESGTSVKEKIRERVIDSRTGKVISEREIESA